MSLFRHIANSMTSHRQAESLVEKDAHKLEVQKYVDLFQCVNFHSSCTYLEIVLKTRN